MDIKNEKNRKGCHVKDNPRRKITWASDSSSNSESDKGSISSLTAEDDRKPEEHLVQRTPGRQRSESPGHRTRETTAQTHKREDRELAEWRRETAESRRTQMDERDQDELNMQTLPGREDNAQKRMEKTRKRLNDKR